MFKGRKFDRSVILLCVRWYLAYSLSLRDIEELIVGRGIAVDRATIHRWIMCENVGLACRKSIVTAGT
jgi:transposase-like protein